MYIMLAIYSVCKKSRIIYVSTKNDNMKKRIILKRIIYYK